MPSDDSRRSDKCHVGGAVKKIELAEIGNGSTVTQEKSGMGQQ